MRFLSAATAAVLAALALAASASAGLWLDLDRSVARPGQVVHGKAVSPCSLCGPRPLYLVDGLKQGGLQLLKRLPRKGDSRFLPVGRFTWKRGGKFAFRVPNLPPGVYQLLAFYRNGAAWTAAPASTILRVRAARGDARVSFGVFSIVVPKGWHWRTLGGPEPKSHIVGFSNASLRVRQGLDPIKQMGRGTFVLTIVPLGEYGSHTAPTIERADFLARTDPSRPRAHAVARHPYCSSGSRCFSIELEYGSEQVPDAVLASINRVLRSLRAVPLRRLSAVDERPVPMMKTPSEVLGVCRRLTLARRICPTRLPKTDSGYVA